MTIKDIKQSMNNVDIICVYSINIIQNNIHNRYNHDYNKALNHQQIYK